MIDHGLEDCLQDVRKHRPHDEVDLVPLHHGLYFRYGQIGLELVVLNDHLHFAPTQLAA